ncbi:MAG: HAMP domain-containing sensor histidine kinase [Thermodesulfobacteriota bacterium]|nr:HAMP domain-containing sensor histidine kinase [Thermodesulfobacteriota bacterium]
MKPAKLYIKIFLSFVLVLIITEILIFGLFIFSAGRSFNSRFERYAKAQALIINDFVKDKIKSEPQIHPAKNKSLQNFLLRLGKSYDAKVWLADSDGTVILKSFQGDIPVDYAGIAKDRVKDYEQFKMHRNFKRRHFFYITIPVEISNSETIIFHLYENMKKTHIEGAFALGLTLIGIIIALLIIPVSRLITKRIKRLKASAIRISEGDLSHRALVKGKDEIEELGRSFNRMADELEKMIKGGRELTANISHELRSPLARIRIAQELLREKLERSEYNDLNRHLCDMQEDIEELDLLIGSILTLSKLDIQETVLKFKPLDLSELIDEILKHLKLNISRRNLHVITLFSVDQAIVGNMDALKTAFSNIFENAVKFTPEKGHVIIKTYFEEDSPVITVTNSFEILPEEELIRIFEPFYRTEQSRVSGSGLGLAITKKIIEKHEGNIRAENSPDGLKIIVSLPASDLKG